MINTLEVAYAVVQGLAESGERYGAEYSLRFSTDLGEFKFYSMTVGDASANTSLGWETCLNELLACIDKKRKETEEKERKEYARLKNKFEDPCCEENYFGADCGCGEVHSLGDPCGYVRPFSCDHHESKMGIDCNCHETVYSTQKLAPGESDSRD